MADPKGLIHGADADMESGSEVEVALTSYQERALLEDEGPMDTVNSKSPFISQDKSQKLSGSQVRRRAKCRILESQGKIQGYEVKDRKIIPIPLTGSSMDEAEKLINMKLPQQQKQSVASTTKGPKTETQIKRQRPEQEAEGKIWDKKPRNDPPQSSQHAVIISYEDNYNAKIALHAYHSIQQELANKLRDALISPITPAYQSERGILIKNGRILINCQNEITRTFVSKVVHEFKWQRPEGPKSFKTWKVEEAPEGTGLIKVTTRIYGPRRTFVEFATIFNKQNPGLNIGGWKDLNNGNPEEGGDYSQSHIMYVGMDMSSLDMLKDKGNKLFYLDRVIFFREFVTKTTGENVAEEVEEKEGDNDKQNA